MDYGGCVMEYCQECTRQVLRYGRKNLDSDCGCYDCNGALDDMDDVEFLCRYETYAAEIKRLREENKRLTVKASCVLRETEARAERDAKIEALEEVLGHPNFMRINNTSAYDIIWSMLKQLKTEEGV